MTRQLAPLTRENRAMLQVGAVVRVETSKGGVTEGVVNYVNSRRDTFVVGGRTYVAYQNDIRIVEGDARPEEMPVLAPSVEEVRDLVADLSHTRGARTRAVSIADIAEAVLGFNAALHKETPAYGGKSPSAWWNEFVSYGGIQRAVKQLTDEGRLVKVKHAGRFSKTPGDERYVDIYGQTGWVTAEDYQAGVEAHEQKRRAADDAALLKRARDIIADRHEAEVLEELRKLRESA